MATLEDVIRENNALRKANERLRAECDHLTRLYAARLAELRATAGMNEHRRIEIIRLEQVIAKLEDEPLPTTYERPRPATCDVCRKGPPTIKRVSDWACARCYEAARDAALAELRR